MKYEHKAIIDAAKREGKLPMEFAKELLGHDLLKAMVGCLSGHAVAFGKMSEQQQDAAIHKMQEELKPAIDNAVRVIVSQGTRTVRMKLKNVAIGKKWKIVGEAEGDEEFLHELADKTQDQSDVLVLLYERDYIQGLDAIQGERDQKDLPLEAAAEKPKAARKKAEKAPEAQKPIDLPDGLIAQAEEFAHKFQNATHAGLQNHLKINFDKAEALLQELEKRGIVSAEDGHGNRMYLRKKAQEAAQEPAGEASDDETYFAARELVIREQRVSAGFLQSELAIGAEQAAAVIRKLEFDGVIGEENDLGGRAVLISGEEQPA